MHIEGWRNIVASADAEGRENIAAMLHESDQAKQLLRDKGYGCLGKGLLETAGEVPPTNEK